MAFDSTGRLVHIVKVINTVHNEKVTASIVLHPWFSVGGGLPPPKRLLPAQTLHDLACSSRRPPLFDALSPGGSLRADRLALEVVLGSPAALGACGHGGPCIPLAGWRSVCGLFP